MFTMNSYNLIITIVTRSNKDFVFTARGGGWFDFIFQLIRRNKPLNKMPNFCLKQIRKYTSVFTLFEYLHHLIDFFPWIFYPLNLVLRNILVQDAVVLPIDVVFERELEADEGEGAKKIRRTLFSRSDLLRGWPAMYCSWSENLVLWRNFLGFI